MFWGWIFFTLCISQYLRRADTVYIMHYAAISLGENYIYDAQGSILGWILFVLCLMQCFPWWILYTLCITRSFRGWIRFTLCSTQYFLGVDTIYTLHYAVVVEVDKFSLCTTQYFRCGYYLYYAQGSILEVDTIYTIHHAVFLFGGYFCTMLGAVFSGNGYFLYCALRSIYGGRILFIVCT